MSDYVEARVTMRRAPIDPNTRNYRPHLVVKPAGTYLGVCFVAGPPSVEPGTEAPVILDLMYPGVDYGALVPGATFEIREGPNTVGEGTVVRRLADLPSRFEASAGENLV